MSVANSVMLLGLLLKNSDISIWYSVVVGSIFLFLSIVVGHYDLKKGIYEKENSLANKYNPEIVKLLNQRKI